MRQQDGLFGLHVRVCSAGMWAQRSRLLKKKLHMIEDTILH